MLKLIKISDIMFLEIKKYECIYHDYKTVRTICIYQICFMCVVCEIHTRDLIAKKSKT